MPSSPSTLLLHPDYAEHRDPERTIPGRPLAPAIARSTINVDPDSGEPLEEDAGDEDKAEAQTDAQAEPPAELQGDAPADAEA